MEENSIRKHWMISFWLYYGMTLFWSLLITGILAFSLLRLGSCRTGSCFIATLLPFSIFSILFIAIVPMLISYNCAYKKRGTAWLKWLLITIPIQSFFLLFKGYSQYKNRIPQIDSVLFLWVLSVLLINALFWINCLRLYRINKSYRVSEKEWELIKDRESPL